jgi:methylenetetrahydrofolate dehydrogenase (NADP+)/methenyltetrahydrofolate cyclohydrolase
MTARILSGKEFAARIKADAKAEAEKLREETGVMPGLAVVIVGEDPASQVYVRNKHKACEAAGIRSVVIEMPEDTPEEELICRVKELADDGSVDGILVQLPLPRHIDEKNVIAAIPPEKDGIQL